MIYFKIFILSAILYLPAMALPILTIGDGHGVDDLIFDQQLIRKADNAIEEDGEAEFAKKAQIEKLRQLKGELT
jgi:hypothetical protein